MNRWSRAAKPTQASAAAAPTSASGPIQPGLEDAPASLADLSVWHCAASASTTGAIRVSDGRAWAREGVVVRVV